jgi:hypothetical protein
MGGVPAFDLKRTEKRDLDRCANCEWHGQLARHQTHDALTETLVLPQHRIVSVVREHVDEEE